MSPMRVATLVVSIVLGTVVLATTVVTRIDQRSLPDDLRSTIYMATVVAWLGLFAAHCRDSAIRHTNERFDRLENLACELAVVVDDYGDRRATDGRVATVRALLVKSGHGAGDSPLGQRLRSVERQ